MKSTDIIQIDSEILGGQPVFRGTRVTIDSLFDYLEYGKTVDEFLDEFPTVSKEQALQIIEIAQKILSSNKIETIYEAIA
jgi:uncharacterized protein (DUF433 family)